MPSSETNTHKHSNHDRSRVVRKKVFRKHSLKTRLINKLNFSFGKDREKIVYIIIGIILAALFAKALIWYIQKTEESASNRIYQVEKFYAEYVS